MGEDKEPKRYNLEERTLNFAKRVRAFIKLLPNTISNVEDVKQLVRASGSVGANYIEANEGLGKKDFVLHVKICRKEAKESRYWLRLVDSGGSTVAENEREWLIHESSEFIKIFSAIIDKSE